MTTAMRWALRISTPLFVAWLSATNGGGSPDLEVRASAAHDLGGCPSASTAARAP
jgi:hypothetical protein